MADSQSEKEQGGAGQVVPDVTESLWRDEPGRVDINILLAEVTGKTESLEEVVTGAARLLDVARQYEEHRLRVFRDRANAIIEVKSHDPDEVDKRKNNSCRRALKWTTAGAVTLGLIGAIYGVAIGTSVLAIGLLLLISIVALLMVGPLASGESLSSNDIVRIVNAAKGIMQTGSAEHSNRKRR